MPRQSNCDGRVTSIATARSSLNTSLVRYSRSWGLWLLLLVAPVGARFWIPAEDSSSSVIVVNGHAPVITSSMLGVSLGIVISTLLLPIAFIYLRSNVTKLQPWQVEEASPASRVAIALGRFGADVAMWGGVLGAMTLAGWLIALMVMPFDRIDLAQITLALWLIAAPALIGVAAIRTLFDSMRITRGAAGEVLYFVLWIAAIAMPSIGADRNVGFAANMTDFAGFVRPLTYSLPAGEKNNFAIGSSPAEKGRIEVDAMAGLLSDGYIESRLAWAGIAVALAAFAGLVYMPHRPRRRRVRGRLLRRLLEPGLPKPAQSDRPPAQLSRYPFPGVVAAEFRLIAQGRLWLLLAAGVAAASAIADFRTVASPAALLLLIFGLTAHAGESERPKLLALARTMLVTPMQRRVAFVLAGTAWSVALMLPEIVKQVSAGAFEALWLSLLTGAAAATAAMLLGAWTRSAFAPRLVLLIAWYTYLSAS
jgi:hypothetical protein